MAIIKSNTENIKLAVNKLKDGELVAFPTETVYGLGADGLNKIAVSKIFEAKQRPSFNPLILHVSSLDMLDEVASFTSDKIKLLTSNFWPGPLTLILKKSEIVPYIVTSGLDTVAVRMPNNKIALELINNSLIQNNYKKEFTPIPVLRNDEIGTVSNTLNQLFSDLYQSKTSLREQKERYDLALQGTKVGLLDWDINSNSVYCSSSVGELIGLKASEFKTNISWLANRVHEDDKEYAHAALISHLKDNNPYDIECRVKHQYSHYIWIRARAQAIRNESGRAIRMVGYFVDISKHRAHEHFMNSLYLLSANAAIKLDAKINKILKEALNFLNLSCGSIDKIENGICTTQYIQCVTECAFKLNSKFNLKDTLCVQTIESKDIVAIHNVAISNLRDNPAHKIHGVNSYISMPLYVHGNIYGTVSFFDKNTRDKPFEERERSFVRLLSHWIGNEITREQYIDYLHDSEVRLEEAVSELTSINSELENFVYVASHDLQEPLRMITNFTGLLENNATNQLDNIAKEYLNIISNSAIQMRLLIKDLLDYARANKEDDKMENVDLNEVINHVCANLEKQIHESNTKLIFNKLPTIYGNKASMISLLQNLISNGIKFQHKDESPVIVIQAREISVGLELSVKDNGIGIHANYLSKIFEPFKRLHAKSEYQGTGIGLAVCKKITDRMDGTIRVESTEGVGSTFYITIPNQTIKAGKAA